MFQIPWLSEEQETSQCKLKILNSVPNEVLCPELLTKNDRIFLVKSKLSKDKENQCVFMNIFDYKIFEYFLVKLKL